MHRYMLLLLLAVGMMKGVDAREMPKGVQKIVENYIRDSTAECGFLFAKKFLHLDESLRSTDIELARPVEGYKLRMDMVETAGANVSVKKVVIPLDKWHIPVHVNGKYIYKMEIAFRRGNWRIIGIGELKPQSIWKKLSSAYPESSGVSPIMVRHANKLFLHFPGDEYRNMFYVKRYYNEDEVRRYYANDSLGLATSNTLDSLDDSRMVFRHLLRTWKKNKPALEELRRKCPGLFDDVQSGGGD